MSGICFFFFPYHQPTSFLLPPKQSLSSLSPLLFLLSVLLEFVMEIGNWERFIRYLEDLKSPQLFSELCGRAASCTLHSPLLCQALLPPSSSIQLPTVPLPFPISLKQTPIMYHDLRHAPG